MRIVITLVGLLVICCLTLRVAECKTRDSKQNALQRKETNVANFVRLVVMRLVFGVASVMGYGENLSDVFGGIFVPPGAGEDYGDYGGSDYIADIF